MNAIETDRLTCRFGKNEAVHDLSIEVPEGCIYGLLGPNGAGKTTTIDVLMNLLRPSGGCATVLGVPSLKLGPRQLRRIGYVSEQQKLPGWMTVGRFLDFCRPLYPDWDQDYCRELVGRFELPAGRKIRALSRGMRVKAALVSALAPRPGLLVLDEPFGGLDAAVRDEISRGILEGAGAEGWTVLLASHDLTEIEHLLDRVAFLDEGRLVLQEEIEDLRGRFRQTIVPIPRDSSALSIDRMPGDWLDVRLGEHSLRFVDSSWKPDESERRLRDLLPECGSVIFEPLSLREIFVALAGRRTRRKEGGA